MASPPPPVLLATSLVPGRDHALQSATVASWIACGFEVISVNGAAEAGAVREAFPNVTVAPVAVTAEKLAKKPVPFIHDVLKALRREATARNLAPAAGTVGIINADIYLRAVPGLADFIRREAEGALVCGPRIDVADAESFALYTPSGEEKFSIGYDYFFMPASALEDFGDSVFCMGMPFWDYWMPLTALLRGMPLKTLASPVALHADHETRWDDGIYLFFHALMTGVIDLARRSRGRDASAAARQFDLFFDFVSHLYNGVFERGTAAAKSGTLPGEAGVAMLADFYDRFQEVAVHHIKTLAAPVTLPEAPPAR